MTRKLGLLSIALTMGCNPDGGLVPCYGDIQVGIYEPAPAEKFPEGMPITLRAMISDACARDLQSTHWTLSSDVQEEVAIEWDITDGELAVTVRENLTLGDHTLTLNGTGESGASGDDTIAVSIIENVPPTVTFVTPAPEGEAFDLAAGTVTVEAIVADPQEDPSTLRLSWTLDGVPFAGPEYADSVGSVSFDLPDAEAGCHDIAVTVTDLLDQTGEDATSFVAYTESEGLEAYTWWLDADGDGWGSVEESVLACEAPDDAVPARSDGLTDCDDTDPEIHPSHPDYCDDGIDSDCSPFSPTGCFSLGEVSADEEDALLRWQDDRTYIGRTIAGIENIGDFNGDGTDDLWLGSRSAESYATNVSINGHSMLLPGPVVGSRELTDEYFSLFCCKASNRMINIFGQSIAAGNDLTGDGRADFLIGAHESSTSNTGSNFNKYGAVFLLNGFDEGAQPKDSINLTSTSRDETYDPEFDDGFGVWTWLGPADKSDFGYEVLVAPDFSGDGLSELVMSAPQSEAVYVIRSEDLPDMPFANLIEDTYHWRLDASTTVGHSMDATDVDGDGYGDLLISADSDNGSVFVVYGREMPTYQSNQNIDTVAGIRWDGGSAGDDAGNDIEALWDLDEDGDNEYAISAPGAEDGDGVVYIVPGFYAADGVYSLDEEVPGVTTLNARQPVRIVGSQVEGLSSLATDGDHNGDGYDDLLIGAPLNSRNASYNGAVYVLYLGPDGWTDWWDTDGYPRDDLSLRAAMETTGPIARISGTSSAQSFGERVRFVGNIKGGVGDDIAASEYERYVWRYRLYFGGAL